MNTKKKEITSLLISVVIAMLFFAAVHFFGTHFENVMWIFMGILLAILLIIMVVVAGFTVLKCLFLVAAELSLLIFLAQSYCAVPKHSPAGDNALQVLMIIGLLYIAAEFFRSLYTVVQENYKIVENDKWSWGKIFTVALYILFVSIFIVDTYQIMKPIVLDTCVFPTSSSNLKAHASSSAPLRM